MEGTENGKKYPVPLGVKVLGIVVMIPVTLLALAMPLVAIVILLQHLV